MPNLPQKLECSFQSDLAELKCVEKMTSKVGEIMSLSQDQVDNLAIAVTEAVGNAIVHGNKKNPDKKAHLSFDLKPGKITILVSDEGEGFIPENIDDPLDPANLLKESGRGIFILKTLMDDVGFEFSGKGTTIRMVMKTDQENE